MPDDANDATGANDAGWAAAKTARTCVSMR
ncbi:hypothetical protein HDG35_005946 [Paraburkholderia sp. JPY681]|nr:hypothetical protein [Paraburkholderia atlantica]